MNSTPLTFPRTHRLSTPARFALVYAGRTRDTRGPLVIHALPNGLEHNRLGLSVSRRVGTAPRRNRIKRLLREAFRAMRHDVPAGLDLIVVVRPHTPLALAEYDRMLRSAVVKLAATWKRRQNILPSAPPMTPSPADAATPPSAEAP